VTTTWRLTVDRTECIGSGLCAGTAPAHFRLVDEKSSPVQELVEPAEAVLNAANFCPVEAITVRDTVDGKVVAPSP